MDWFFRPKVQLGLFVNLIFVVFTIVSPIFGEHRRSVYIARTVEYDPPLISHAPLPPRPAPSKITSVESDGQVSVSLRDDLTLVRKPDRTLVFAPSFSARARPAAELPSTVTLRFTIFSSGEEACPDACMLVINADGARVWESAANGTFSTGWTRNKVPASTITLDDGQVAETLAAETFTTQIPYVTFVNIISARRVVLSLGPDKVELTDDQIQILREMNRRGVPTSNF
jgi:hypothetical protein